jgi:hypothetical protein
MGSITKVSSGGRTRWRTPDGSSRSKTFARKVDSQDHLTSTEHTKRTGSYVDPSDGRVTFKSYAEQWRMAQVHRPGTEAQVETNLRLHVYPRVGSRPIGGIRQSEIQSLVKALVTEDGGRKPLAASTAGTVFVWVATIFAAAVADRVIAQTPCREIKIAEVEQAKVVPLNRQS